MKTKISVLMILILLFQSGCNYIDINRVIFATYLIIDEIDGQVYVYAEVFEAFRNIEKNAEEGVDLYLIADGRTLFEAIRNINDGVKFKVNYEQITTIIFTERAAKQGIGRYLDFLVRDQELLLRPYIVIYTGDPETLLKTYTGQDILEGSYFEEMYENTTKAGSFGAIKLYDYMNQRAFGNNVDVLTIMHLAYTPYPIVTMHEAAVLKDDKMVERMASDDAVVYYWLSGRGKKGIIVIPHPYDDKKSMTIEILSNKIKTEIEYSGNPEEVIKYIKKVYIKATVGETETELDLRNPQTQKAIVDLMKENIIELCLKTFGKYKQKGLDIFEVQESFMRKYPHAPISDAFQNSVLELEIDIKLEGSSDTDNFFSEPTTP